jgi:hypothetical protein
LNWSMCVIVSCALCPKFNLGKSYWMLIATANVYP